MNIGWMILFEWLMLKYTQEKGGNGFKSTPRVHYSCVLVWPIYMMQNPNYFIYLWKIDVCNFVSCKGFKNYFMLSSLIH
jgi:hypothetical protein